MESSTKRVTFTHEIAAQYAQFELHGEYRLAAHAVREKLRAHRRTTKYLVDYGCGAGKSTRAVLDCVAPGGRVTGIDISAAMLDEATRLTPPSLPAAHGLDVDYRLIQVATGGAITVPVESGSADVVVSTQVMQEIQAPQELGAAFAEIGRITKDGGHFVGVFANDEITCQTFVSWTFAPFPENVGRTDNIRKCRSGIIPDIMWENDRHWSCDLFTASIASAGFHILSVERPLASPDVPPNPDDPTATWRDELLVSPFLVIAARKRSMPFAGEAAYENQRT